MHIKIIAVPPLQIIRFGSFVAAQIHNDAAHTKTLHWFEANRIKTAIKFLWTLLWNGMNDKKTTRNFLRIFSCNTVSADEDAAGARTCFMHTKNDK